MAKVTGVGGVFIKAKDTKALQAWYVEQLGVPLAPEGYIAFEGPEAQGTTALGFFPLEPKPGATEQAIVNFRVDSLDELLAKLAAAGTRIDPDQQDYGFGRFAWIWDPEGNRVELWEPVPETGDTEA
jgi:predicted enzyme related to lactoylglutathione lyase